MLIHYFPTYSIYNNTTNSDSTVLAFIIACIISFRSMWVSRERRLDDRKVKDEKKHHISRALGQSSSVGGEKNIRWRQLHDTLMQTLWELEGADMEWDGSYLINHEPPSGRLTVDFSQWGSTFVPGSSTHAAASTQHWQEDSHVGGSSSV